MRKYTRDDVQMHVVGYGYNGYGYNVLPAVNVKVYAQVTREIVEEVKREQAWEADGPDLEWVESQLERSPDWFDIACESESEYLREWGREIFAEAGHRVKLWHEGGQGGWIVVDGLPGLEEWDAILLGKWRKFERIAREIADGVPAQMVTLLLFNVWEPMQEEHAEDVSAAMSEGVMVF